MEILKLFQENLNLIAIAAACVAWGRLSQKVENLAQNLKDLQKSLKDIHELFLSKKL